jgi:hypothetical protein
VTYEEALTFADAEVLRLGHEHVAWPVLVMHLIGKLDFEITCGGVVQWLGNTSGGYTRETIKALEEIGARRCAEIVRQIVAPFPGGVPLADEVARTAQVVDLDPNHYPMWNRLADELLEWPDDVDQLLRAHFAAHAAAFERTAHG